jgi:hypothetical protein
VGKCGFLFWNPSRGLCLLDDAGVADANLIVPPVYDQYWIQSAGWMRGMSSACMVPKYPTADPCIAATRL